MSTTNWISSPSIDIIKLYRAKKRRSREWVTGTLIGCDEIKTSSNESVKINKDTVCMCFSLHNPYYGWDAPTPIYEKDVVCLQNMKTGKRYYCILRCYKDEKKLQWILEEINKNPFVMDFVKFCVYPDPDIFLSIIGNIIDDEELLHRCKQKERG